MKKIKLYLKKDGFTLVELLAAILLLSLVIIIFLNIFSNSINLSQKVEEKLTATNIAEKVLNTVRRGDPSISLGIHYYESKVNGRTYYSVVDITQPEYESKLGLKRVYVKVYSSENYSSATKADSEIYGYIEPGGK